MKSQSFEGSINRGSNELYTSTRKQILASNGDFVKIGNNEVYYQVEETKQITLKKKFQSHGDYLTIKGNYEFKIFPGDNAKLYYHDYEAVLINKITKSAKGNSFGDRFFFQGGYPSSSRENLTGKYTEIKVTAVNKDGSVKEVNIVEPGKYITPPENPIIAKNQDGKTIEVEAEFDYSSESSVFERDFTSVEFKDGKTHLRLYYPFPEEIDNAELILSKSILYLNKEYGAAPVHGLLCQTTSDFSPINKIPLVPPNAIAPHAIYNKAVEVVDNRLADIEKRLVRLENRN